MTQDLSRAICEKCGMKPEYTCSYTGNICPVESIGEFNTKCPMTEVVKECETRSKEPRCIDFGKPKNFKTLFDLKIDHPCYPTMVEMVVNSNDCYFCNSREFIMNVLDCLNSDFNSEDIKQSIREAEWDYE